MSGTSQQHGQSRGHHHQYQTTHQPLQSFDDSRNIPYPPQNLSIQQQIEQLQQSIAANQQAAQVFRLS